MEYTKPTVVAQNNNAGSYAAGCPDDTYGGSPWCKNCERTE
jgi:hypothetical protein